MKKLVALLCFGVVFGVLGKNYEDPKAANSKEAEKKADKSAKENVILDLEEAIVSAYNNNAAWKASQAERSMAFEQYKQAEAIFLPTIDATLSTSRTGNEIMDYKRDKTYPVTEEGETKYAVPVEGDLLPGRDVSKKTQTQMALRLNQNLFKSFQDVNYAKSKKNSAKAAFHKLKKAEQDLIVNVVQIYTAVWAERQKLQAHEKKEQNLKKLYESQKICLAAGMATPADVAEAKAKYKTAVYEKVDAKTRVVEAEARFAYITGMEASKNIFIPNLTINLPENLEKLEKIALVSNQEILQERFADLAALNDLDKAKGELGPRCDLKLELGRNLNKPENYLGYTSHQNTYNAELSVTMPVFNMQNYSNISIYSERAKQAKFASENKILEVKSDCQICWSAYKSAEAAISANRAAVESAEISSASNLDQTNLGMKSNTEFLDAETSLLNARINLANSIKGKIDAAIKLFALTGNLDLRSMLVTLKKHKGVLDPVATDKTRKKFRLAQKSGKQISQEDWLRRIAENKARAAEKRQVQRTVVR